MRQNYLIFLLIQITFYAEFSKYIRLALLQQYQNLHQMNKNEKNLSHQPKISKIYSPFQKQKEINTDNNNNPFSLQLSPWSNQSKHFQLNYITKNDILQSLSQLNSPYQSKFVISQMKPSRNSVDLTTIHSKVSRYLQSENKTNRNSLQTSKRNRKLNKNHDTIQTTQNQLKIAKLKNISLEWDDDLIYSPQKKYKQQILQTRVSTALAKQAQKIVNSQANEGYQSSIYQLRKNKIPKILSKQKKGVFSSFSRQKQQGSQQDQFSDYQIMTSRSVYGKVSENKNNKQNKNEVQTVFKQENHKKKNEQIKEANAQDQSELRGSKNSKKNKQSQNMDNSSPKNLISTIQIDFQKLQTNSPTSLTPFQKYEPYRINLNKNGYRIYNRNNNRNNQISTQRQKQSWIG